MPYGLIKNVIRIANPAMVVSGVIDLFCAQPFGSRSLLQRIFAMTMNDGIKSFQRSIESLVSRVDDSVLCAKLKDFTEATEDVKNAIRQEAAEDGIDIVVAILRSELIEPYLGPQQIEKLFNAYVAWNNVVDNVCSPFLFGGAS